MKQVTLLLGAACLALAGCGVDGAPEPKAKPVKTGLTVSGTAKIGIRGTL